MKDFELKMQAKVPPEFPLFLRALKRWEVVKDKLMSMQSIFAKPQQIDAFKEITTKKDDYLAACRDLDLAEREVLASSAEVWGCQMLPLAPELEGVRASFMGWKERSRPKTLSDEIINAAVSNVVAKVPVPVLNETSRSDGISITEFEDGAVEISDGKKVSVIRKGAFIENRDPRRSSRYKFMRYSAIDTAPLVFEQEGTNKDLRLTAEKFLGYWRTVEG